MKHLRVGLSDNNAGQKGMLWLDRITLKMVDMWKVWAHALWNPFSFASYLMRSLHVSLLTCVISMVGEVGEGFFWGILVGTWTRWKVFSPRFWFNPNHGFNLIETTKFRSEKHFREIETMVLISVLIKVFGIKTMVSSTLKTEIKTKTRTWKIPWTRSLTCICLSNWV